MYLRIVLFITLNVFTILLPAQNVQMLQKTLDSLKVEISILLQKIEELELIEKEYMRLIEDYKSVVSLETADLRPVSGGELIEHAWYTLSYSEENEQALWVHYKLTNEMIKGTAPRTDNFRVDNTVSTLSAYPEDYTSSGYDRGHLCPAADMCFNLVSMSESFYMSNMSPQVPAFNRGIWKKLEGTVRMWAFVEQEIHVVTGPVFRDNLGVLPQSNITIPGYYYKVIYDPTGEQKMLALVLPNARGEKPLPEYVVTVNYVEVLTGIDFFAALPDELENRLEANSDASLWTFSEYKGAVPDNDVSVQCKGKSNSSGMQCRNKTTNANGYCHVHQSQAPGN